MLEVFINEGLKRDAVASLCSIEYMIKQSFGPIGMLHSLLRESEIIFYYFIDVFFYIRHFSESSKDWQGKHQSKIYQL